MNLGNYINNLLQEHETVIVPGFGAFIAEHVPAVISDNEILPPSKKITFTNLVKNNDGLLAGYIAETEKLPLSGSYKIIEDQVADTIYKLDKGEKVEFENIGLLYNNDQGKICFEMLGNNDSSAFWFMAVSLDDVEEEVVEEPHGEDPEIIQDELKTEEVQQSHEEFTEEIFAEAELQPVQEKDAEPVEDVVTELELTEVYDDYPVPPKSRNKAKWLFLLLIPLAIGAYFGLRNNKPKSVNIESPELQQALNQIVAADSIQSDTIPNTDTLPRLTTDQMVVDTSKFYIVGGGFKNEENAGKFALQLKEKGVNAVRLGQRGNMHLVGVAWFDTQTDAQKALNVYCREDSTCGMWIYKIKSPNP